MAPAEHNREGGTNLPTGRHVNEPCDLQSALMRTKRSKGQLQAGKLLTFTIGVLVRQILSVYVNCIHTYRLNRISTSIDLCTTGAQRCTEVYRTGI